MSERQDEPLVEVEAGRISRPTSTSFFFRSDKEDGKDDVEGEAAEEEEPEDWRALRLREILAQRSERLPEREEATFRLPWSDLLQAVEQVMREIDEGNHVDRDSPTLVNYDPDDAESISTERLMAEAFDADAETLCTPSPLPTTGAGEETVIQNSPELVAAQQEAAYLRGKLTRADEEKAELERRLANAEEAAEAASIQMHQGSDRQQEAEHAKARAHQDLEAARAQSERLQVALQLAQDEVSSGAKAAAEAAAASAAERDTALAEASAVNAELQETRASVEEALTARDEAETQFAASREDSSAARRRFLKTRVDLEERIAGLEEELQRRTAGHERERDSLLADLRKTEQILRDLFGKLPEEELRGWVPGLEREPWSEETAIRHLALVLERLDGYRGERRQARLLTVPDYDQLTARIDQGRAEVPAAQQPRLARLKQELEQAQSQFEALREAHLSRQARLGELIELNAVVSRSLAFERELTALGL